MDQCHATACRLGNITEIAELRDEITRLIGPESLVVQKILHSGTHSGDIISLDSLPAVSAELNSIFKTGEQSPQLQHFLASRQEPIRAAEDEKDV